MIPGPGSEDGTILMNFCLRTPSNASLYRQIASFVRLYLESNPELIYARNARGENALVFAATTNKSAVSCYLAQLYSDPNERDGEGHTVLHMMARKGDDCADALEDMLALRGSDGRRLFRLDMVNAGGKTPLDVAVACRDLYSTGRTRAVYERVIAAFHRVIEEDAREMMMAASEEDVTAPMTFRNF